MSLLKFNSIKVWFDIDVILLLPNHLYCNHGNGSLVFSAVNHRFYSGSSETRDYRIGSLCLSDKLTALRSNSSSLSLKKPHGVMVSVLDSSAEGRRFE